MQPTSEKLIRDLIPDISHPDYPSMITRRVKNILEHILFLEEKKSEEYCEFHNAENEEREMEEAADVLEVLDTLIYLYEMDSNLPLRECIIHEREVFTQKIREEYILSLSQILQIQLQKREKKWGFQKGIIWLQKGI